MDVVGADCVYLSDECSQEGVFSLWSDAWSVGDPVNLPDLSDSDEFKDILFADAMVQSTERCGDNGDWLSDVLQSACPNAIAGCVATASSIAGEPSPSCDLGVLSPTDSGHHSISSSTPAVQEVTVADAETDDILELLDERTTDPVMLKELNNNDGDDLAAGLAATSHDTAVNQGRDDMRSCEPMEYEYKFTSERSQRIAARRAEIALAREESESNDSDDDDDDAQVSRCFRSRRQSHASEMSSSRRGRSRAADVNRNALNARINRQKKKAYMASLEAQKARLLSENKRMKSDLSSLVSERKNLVNEVTYLKSVLANDSALAKLVQSINGPPLKLSSRFNCAAMQKQKYVESDHNYGPPPPSRLSGVKAGGICLHVTENQLSMELCHHCACMAGGSYNDNGFDP